MVLRKILYWSLWLVSLDRLKLFGALRLGTFETSNLLNLIFCLRYFRGLLLFYFFWGLDLYWFNLGWLNDWLCWLGLLNLLGFGLSLLHYWLSFSRLCELCFNFSFYSFLGDWSLFDFLRFFLNGDLFLFDNWLGFLDNWQHL